MSDACRILSDALEHEPATALDHHAAHVATCETCAAYAALVAELRAEPAPVDDVTRARWLARLSPELDAIAANRATPRRPWRALAAVATVAVVAGGLGWWLGRSPDAPAPAVAIDRALLRPYVVTGAAGDGVATALLSDRFAALQAYDGVVIRATTDRAGAQRIALVGPTTVGVTTATAETIDLSVVGEVLVDTHADQVLRIRAGEIVVRAQQATFAVASYDHSTVVFVDRGEVDLGAMRLHAGEWFGPPAARSAALVTALRAHEHSIPPPLGRSGILALDGHAPAITQDGGVLGTAPLWARVAPGDIVVVSTGAIERRTTIAIHDGETSRVAAEPTLVQLAPPSTPIASSPPTAPSTAHVASPPIATSHAGSAARVVAVHAGSAVAPESAAELYVRAEAALRDGDPAAAESIWLQLVADHPTAPQVAPALYDLANLVRSRDRAAARGYLDRLLAGTPGALREPATYQSCRLSVDAGDLDRAERCFLDFRARFPSSPHDAEVLAWLAGRAEAQGGCVAAKPLATEYLGKYPTGAFAARASACRGAP